eukprot:m.108152 g.108152  ORF g.108152 m.108152 type:complete len:330 (+) comp15859_c1_seq4:1265-2254(+)
MGRGKERHIYVDVVRGQADGDGSSERPYRTLEQARAAAAQQSTLCPGIKLVNTPVVESPCGLHTCGPCTKANGRRKCPGENCFVWIAVAAKSHTCGWRKIEPDHDADAHEAASNSPSTQGFEKIRKKILALAERASTQYGWDGIIFGMADGAARGGKTARVMYASPRNRLFEVDPRGNFLVRKEVTDQALVREAASCLNTLTNSMTPRERPVSMSESQFAVPTAARDHHYAPPPAPVEMISHQPETPAYMMPTHAHMMQLTSQGLMMPQHAAHAAHAAHAMSLGIPQSVFYQQQAIPNLTGQFFDPRFAQLPSSSSAFDHPHAAKKPRP